MIETPPGSHYLQHKEWATVRSQYDWRARSLRLLTPEGEQPATVYTRRLLPIGKLAYIPYCLPVLGQKEAAENIKRLQDGCNDCFAVIIEPQQLATSVNQDFLLKSGLLRTWGAGIQNLSTLMVDLSPSEDEIFGHFTKEKRYNVRKAERRGVEIREVPIDQAGLDQIFKLKEATVERAGHYYRPKKFMYEMWSGFGRAQKARLFLAYSGEQLASGVMVLHDGSQAWSRDSGSLREGSSLGAPSYMQWEVMKTLKKAGIQRYDLCGIRPADQRDPSNPRYGIFRYKSGFNPEGIEDYCGPYDLVLHPARYQMWQRLKGGYIRWSMSVSKNYFF